ncbi:hypothetical protein Bbelb_365610 [Branchiostoma belcheri]|nr:hypothetical protein Bbelb_365610 [Branchiostoma belcheri]
MSTSVGPARPAADLNLGNTAQICPEIAKYTSSQRRIKPRSQYKIEVHAAPRGAVFDTIRRDLEPRCLELGPERIAVTLGWAAKEEFAAKGEFFLNKTSKKPQPCDPELGPCSPGLGPCGPELGPCSPGLGPCGPELGPCSPGLGPCGPELGPCSPELGPCSPGLGPCGPELGPCSPELGPCCPELGPCGPELRPCGLELRPCGPELDPVARSCTNYTECNERMKIATQNQKVCGNTEVFRRRVEDGVSGESGLPVARCDSWLDVPHS